MPYDGSTYHNPEIPSLDGINKVIELLGDERKWCKQQLRSSDGRHCILGAMKAADATLALKQSILAAIKQVTGRDYRRIDAFNDHPKTTHPMVMKVLNTARENIIAEAAGGWATPAPQRAVRVAKGALAKMRELVGA